MALITLPLLAPSWGVSRAVPLGALLCQSWHFVGWHVLLVVTVFLKNDIMAWSQWQNMKLISPMKTVTVLKKYYFCFIKCKLNWDRKKFTNYYLCCDIFHGKQLLVWHLTTKHTKCGFQSCTFLLLYITCGNINGSCWIMRTGEGDCAVSCNSIRKQLYNSLQFYRCSLWKKIYWLQKD